MLDTCYRKSCIYYSWKNSVWEYDLDKIFTEFESQTYGSQINNDFVAKRLQELPSTTRSLLAWASLIGNTFSFSLVKKLLSGENSPPNVCMCTPPLMPVDLLYITEANSLPCQSWITNIT